VIVFLSWKIFKKRGDIAKNGHFTEKMVIICTFLDLENFKNQKMDSELEYKYGFWFIVDVF